MNIKDLTNELQKLTRAPKFVGVDYVTKDRGERSRFTLLVGASYLALVRESITELDLRLKNARGIEKVVLRDLRASMQESLDAAAQGRSHIDNTKAGQYAYIRTHNGIVIPGLRVNLNDTTAELCGRIHAQVVLQPGEPKIPVKHRSPATALRASLRRALPVNRWLTLAVDLGHIETVRINGETLEFV
jgi:hypothetical protein